MNDPFDAKGFARRAKRAELGIVQEDMDVEITEIGSHRAQIQALEVGESFCRAKRFDGDEVTKDELQTTSRGLRLATQATVWRVGKNTGRTFTIEEGDIRTRSHDILVVLVVTRLS